MRYMTAPLMVKFFEGYKDHYYSHPEGKLTALMESGLRCDYLTEALIKHWSGKFEDTTIEERAAVYGEDYPYVGVATLSHPYK